MNMKFTLDELLELSAKNRRRKLDILILEYAVLQAKFDSPEQSWYFRRANESNRLKLASKLESYEAYRRLINSSTEEELEGEIEALRVRLIQRESMPRVNFVSYHIIGGIKGSIKYWEERLEVKRQVGILKNIDYYLKDKKTLLDLLQVIEP